MMSTVESILNSTENLDHVFAYELLAAYWLVRSDTNGSPNNITVASRPDHVWRTDRVPVGKTGGLKKHCGKFRGLLRGKPVGDTWTKSDEDLLSGDALTTPAKQHRRILAACSARASRLARSFDSTTTHEVSDTHGLPALLAVALHEYHAAPRRQRSKWTEAQDAALLLWHLRNSDPSDARKVSPPRA